MLATDNLLPNFGGFSTQQQETTYCKFISKLISILSDEIISNKKAVPSNTSFDKKIIKVYKAIKVMEKQKMGQPKYSENIKDLAKYLFALRDEPSQS